MSPRLHSAGRDILVHELSHQWAGNAAVPGPVEGATWMVEGLAEYLVMLAAEEMDEDVDVDAIGQRLQDRVGTDTTQPLDEFHAMLDFGDRAAAYDRPALLYHALRLEIGDDASFAFVRSLVQDNLHQTFVVDDAATVGSG